MLKENSNNPKSKEKIKKANDADGNIGCYSNPFINFICTVQTFLIQNPTIKILSPTRDTPNEKITNEPKMPSVVCTAKLSNYNSHNVNFDWEYWVSYNYQRIDKHDTEVYSPKFHKKVKGKTLDWPKLCSRVEKFCFSGKYQENVQNEITTKWIVGFKADSLKSMYIKAPIPQRSKGVYKNCPYHKDGVPWHGSYPGDSTKIIQEWYPNCGNDVFTGGYVWIKVSAINESGHIVAWDTLSANMILGNNQNNEDIVADCDTKILKAILKKESGKIQFTDGNKVVFPYGQADGFPVYGYPNGYGLMQIDNSPESTELDLWNWKINLNDGKVKIINSLIKETDIFLQYKFDHNSETFLKNLFERYNAGPINTYSKWDGENLIDNPDWQDYGNSVYTIYQGL